VPMMSLSEIRSYYPEYLHNRGEFLIREYLQYKILELLFQSPYANKFAFLGGTCLRIVHNSQRFSEDLDFDSFELSEQDFQKVSDFIQKGLENQGFIIEMKNVLRGAYLCYIRFPGLLYEAGLSGHREAKILINLDTEPQHFSFEPARVFLNKFDVFTVIRTSPPDLLLSQKIVTITHRRQPKGRDFFDILFLLGKTKPNYDFLKSRLEIATPVALKKHILSVCNKLNFKDLAKDVQPFLFQPADARKIELFGEYMQTVEW
jgi:predicted nucleotidyltransferase component of viral defense system